MNDPLIGVIQTLYKSQMYRWIRKARHTLRNKPSNVKHVSFIVDGKQLICYGINHPFKTDPLSHQYGYRFNAIHSEVAALKVFPYPLMELCKYTMINVRILADGSVGMAKPCKICQKLLRDFGIKKVIYTSKYGTFEELNEG